MIEVIEDNRRRYKVTCPKCNSILQYMDEDIRRQRTGKTREKLDLISPNDVIEIEWIDYIVCPLCDCVISIQQVWREL